MTIFVIIAQRKEKYEGEYQPEVLDAIDEYGNDENGEAWANEKAEEYRKTNEFENVQVVQVFVPTSQIMLILRPPNNVTGKIIQ